MVNPGAEAKTIANLWDVGVKLPWKTNGAVKAGDFFTYDATVAEANTGQLILRPTTERTFDVRSATGVVGCNLGTDGIVTVVFNENADSAAEWAGSVTTSATIHTPAPPTRISWCRSATRWSRARSTWSCAPPVKLALSREGWIGPERRGDKEQGHHVARHPAGR